MTKNYTHFILLFILFVFAKSQGQNQTVGVFRNDSLAVKGYTLFSPISDNSSYLIDNCGYLINKWDFDNVPGMIGYLLEDGSIIRASRLFNGFGAGGSGGRIEIKSWDDELLWQFDYSNEVVKQHHDLAYLPNGNVLIIAWERKALNEVLQSGRIPESIGSNGVWFEHIVEVKPTGLFSGDIVWEWHMFDHMVQDYSSVSDNFGTVEDEVSKIDVNYQAFSIFGNGMPGASDWIHLNSIDYREDLDLILISSRNTSEIYIIDHSTTTEEAKGSTGGRFGKGGDFLFRWGNDEVFRNEQNPQQLFSQHDAAWVEHKGSYTGEISVFNNGLGREGGDQSSVELIHPIFNDQGFVFDSVNHTYSLEYRESIFPTSQYNFTSPRISGAQFFEGGNVLITSGNNGKVYELDDEGKLVWEYGVPISQFGPTPQGVEPILNDIFRAVKYALNYPAFLERELVQGELIEGHSEFFSCMLYDEMSTSTMEVSSHNMVLLYPNPAVDWISVVVNYDEVFYYEIYDALASLLQNGITRSKEKIYLEDLESGIYFLKLNINNQPQTYKFLVH